MLERSKKYLTHDENDRAYDHGLLRTLSATRPVSSRTTPWRYGAHPELPSHLCTKTVHAGEDPQKPQRRAREGTCRDDSAGVTSQQRRRTERSIRSTGCHCCCMKPLIAGTFHFVGRRLSRRSHAEHRDHTSFTAIHAVHCGMHQGGCGNTITDEFE